MDSMPETFNSSYGAAVVLGHTFVRARCSTLGTARSEAKLMIDVGFKCVSLNSER